MKKALFIIVLAALLVIGVMLHVGANIEASNATIERVDKKIGGHRYGK